MCLTKYLWVQGSTRLICSLPPCVEGHAGGIADSEAAGHCLVRWQLPQMMAAGQSLLLLQMLRELRSLQQACASPHSSQNLS